MSQNPSLAMRLEQDRLSRATAEIERYLNEFDVAAERSRRRYNKMAGIAGQFILVTAIAVSFLVWRGYV